MNNVDTLLVLSDVFSLYLKHEPILIATLSRVCTSFNKKFGATIHKLEKLACDGYFANVNITEIITTYGEPSERLCKIYCIDLRTTFTKIPNYKLLESEFSKLLDIATTSPRYRLCKIKMLEIYDIIAICTLLDEINLVRRVSNYAIDMGWYLNVMADILG